MTGLHEGAGIVAPVRLVKIGSQKMAGIILQQGIHPNRVLTGQMVETTAQVLPEKVNNTDGHRMRIFRMLVQCCAADARPFSVPIDFGKKAPDFKDMTWVKVTGKVSYKKEGDQTVPLIEVSKVEETTAPDNAMIY